jgi:hypothetical protein
MSVLKNYNLDKDRDFISAQELLHELRNELTVYFERSILDDSHFYPVIRDCLSKLGAKIYPVGNTVLYVSNYKVALPKDFHKLILAVGCFEYVITSTPNDNPQLYDVTEAQLQDYLISKPSETCLDECGENFYVIQRFETFDVTFKEYCPLSVSKKSFPQCSNNCFNKAIISQNQIELQGDMLYAGFEEGSVYMDYLQKPEKHDIDGVDLLIPDFAPIREWIKMACVKKAFQVMYWNNDADVQQRYQDSKNELTILETRARAFARQAEFSELYNMRKVFFGRYNKFEQLVYGPGQSYLTDKNYLRGYR